MEKLIRRERDVLRSILSAITALSNIPPDEREDSGLDHVIDQLKDSAECQQARIDLRVRRHEITKSGAPTGRLDSETLKEKQSSEHYQDFLVDIRSLFGKENENMVQPNTVVELLKTVSGKEFVEQYGIHLIYETEDEVLTLMDGQGNILFHLVGEDNYEELKSSLDHPWYGQLCPEVKPTGNQYVPPEERRQLLELKEVRERPKKFLIGKLFAAFYECLDIYDRVKYSYRRDQNADSIFLTLYGEDVAGYKLSNVAWPHIEVVKNPKGVITLRERGDWAKLSPFERGAIRRRFENANSGKHCSYFSPLRGTDVFRPVEPGRSHDRFDAIGKYHIDH